MSKQPYIPFYVGDYLKDTRVLPLAVRGAWVDMILFMWDNPVRGELIGTLEEVARMIGCDKSEAEFALNLLKQKGTANIDLLPTGEWKIVSRKMKRDHEISKKRSKAGKTGVEVKFAQANASAKLKQNPDIDNEDDNESKIDNVSEKILEIGERSELWIGISAKYIEESPRRIYDLLKYFELTGQADVFKANGWNKKYKPFLKENPGRVFTDENFLYNSFKTFCTNVKRSGKESIERTQSFGTDYGSGITAVQGD